jgi:cytochrome c oxidase cbb3-type subunit 3
VVTDKLFNPGCQSFAGKIAPEQIWEIAAYVRSMGGQGPKSARPGRDDG